MAVIVDLDGVVWLAEREIEGSGAAANRLRDAGHRVLFVTNNSSPTVEELLGKLSDMGVEVDPDDLITSAQAAATLVEPGSTVLVCAGAGVEQALEARDIRTVDEGNADAVIVGFHRHFDFDRLTAAFRAVADGARLIGTNDDATYPTPDGAVPGGGSLLAAVATAAGAEPVIAGKPHPPMVDLVRDRLGDELDGAVLVGDRPSTDGVLAQRLGVRFALVLTGVTAADQAAIEPAPDITAPDLASLVGEDGQLEPADNG